MELLIPQNKMGKNFVIVLDEINDSDYHGENELLLDIEVSCYLRHFFVLPCPIVKWIDFYSNHNKKSGPQRTQSLQKPNLGHSFNKDTSVEILAENKVNAEVINISFSLDSSDTNEGFSSYENETMKQCFKWNNDWILGTTKEIAHPKALSWKSV